MRQAYDYWQDQPGSCPRPERRGRGHQAARTPRPRCSCPTAEAGGASYARGGTSSAEGRPSSGTPKRAKRPRAHFRESSLRGSPSDPNRSGGAPDGATKRCPPGPPDRNAATPAWPPPSTRLKRIRADGAAGPGTWLRVTLAHRESIQAPHRPPTRRHEAGCGAIAVRARAQTAIIDRAPGTLNNRPDRSLVSARLGPLSLIGYEA